MDKRLVEEMKNPFQLWQVERGVADVKDIIPLATALWGICPCNARGKEND